MNKIIEITNSVIESHKGMTDSFDEYIERQKRALTFYDSIIKLNYLKGSYCRLAESRFSDHNKSVGRLLTS